MKASHYSSWLLALSLFAALAVPTFAADKGHGQKLQDIIAQLDLSADQNTKVSSIISDMQQKVKAAHKEARTNGDPDAAKDKIKTVRKEGMHKIEAVLTDEQKTKFHDLLKQAEQERKAEKAGNATTQPAAQ